MNRRLRSVPGVWEETDAEKLNFNIFIIFIIFNIHFQNLYYSVFRTNTSRPLQKQRVFIFLRPWFFKKKKKNITVYDVYPTEISRSEKRKNLTNLILLVPGIAVYEVITDDKPSVLIFASFITKLPGFHVSVDCPVIGWFSDTTTTAYDYCETKNKKHDLFDIDIRTNRLWDKTQNIRFEPEFFFFLINARTRILSPTPVSLGRIFRYQLSINKHDLSLRMESRYLYKHKMLYFSIKIIFNRNQTYVCVYFDIAYLFILTCSRFDLYFLNNFTS